MNEKLNDEISFKQRKSKIIQIIIITFCFQKLKLLGIFLRSKREEKNKIKLEGGRAEEMTSDM